jgi:hypothetical protein
MLYLQKAHRTSNHKKIQCCFGFIYEWKEVFFSFGENPLPKASEPGLKYNMNNIKTTEKMQVIIGKEFGCLWAKIRETISGSACVLSRRKFLRNSKKYSYIQLK